ncbi:MAG TPA: DNA polymerase III subunit delta [Candidatus Krumholzibacteria bacterium]|nr:DNA polymerase III subunit delta [Candidatus Krumholzibacteria bacterium]
MAARSQKKSFGVDDLRREIEKSGPEPLYAVLGEEPLLAEEAVAALVEATVPAAARDFNCNTYSGDDESARQFLAQAQSFPFLSERRLVIVRRFDKLPLRDVRAESAVLEYLESPTPSTVLVLVAAKLDRRTRLAQAIEKRCRIIQVDGLPVASLPDWVRARFALQGLDVEPRFCTSLVQLVGESLLDLRNEVDKVALRYGAGYRIGADEVTSTVGQYRQEEVWAVNRALRADNMGGFLQALARVLEVDDDPIRVVAVLARQVSSLLRFKLLQDRGVRRPDELARRLELPPFAIADLAAQAASFSRKQLSLWLRNLQQADVQMKSVALPPRWVLERALVNSFLGQDLA